MASDPLLDLVFAGELSVDDYLARRQEHQRATAAGDVKELCAFLAQVAPWRRSHVEPVRDLGLLKKAFAEGRLSRERLVAELEQERRACRPGTFRRQEIDAELAQLARAFPRS